MESSIRTATTEDLPRITEIIASHPDAIYQHHDYEYLMKIRHFSETCLVAEQSGKIVGFIVGYRGGSKNDTFFVWQVAVDRNYKGQGIGYQLVMKSIENVLELGCQRLECTITSPESKRTFEKVADKVGTQLRKIGDVKFRIPKSSVVDSEELFEVPLVTRIG